MNKSLSSWTKFFVLAMTLAVPQLSYGQNSEACQAIVQEVYKGLNARSAAKVKPHLSPKFTMADQPYNISVMILDELFRSSEDQVKNIVKLSEKKAGDKLTLIYQAEFGKNEVEKSTFVFDKNNKLVNLDLFPMEVQKQ